MAKIEIYTWSNCPYCIRAKDFFNQRRLEFKEIDLDGHEDKLQELRTRTGFRTVPQIFINDQFVGGFQELTALESQGKLQGMLDGTP